MPLCLKESCAVGISQPVQLFEQPCFASCQLVLSGNSDREIQFEAFDKDLDADDFLGRCVSCLLVINVELVVKIKSVESSVRRSLGSTKLVCM